MGVKSVGDQRAEVVDVEDCPLLVRQSYDRVEVESLIQRNESFGRGAV